MLDLADYANLNCADKPIVISADSVHQYDINSAKGNRKVRREIITFTRIHHTNPYIPSVTVLFSVENENIGTITIEDPFDDEYVIGFSPDEINIDLIPDITRMSNLFVSIGWIKKVEAYIIYPVNE